MTMQAQVVDALNAFRKRLQCSICMSLCIAPTLLPCSHFFCRRCVSALVAAANAEHAASASAFVQPRRRVGEFDCPECRTRTTQRQTLPDETLAEVTALFTELRAAIEDEEGLQLSQDVPLTTHRIPAPNNSPPRAPHAVTSSHARRKRTRSPATGRRTPQRRPGRTTPAALDNSMDEDAEAEEKHHHEAPALMLDDEPPPLEAAPFLPPSPSRLPRTPRTARVSSSTPALHPRTAVTPSTGRPSAVPSLFAPAADEASAPSTPAPPLRPIHPNLPASAVSPFSSLSAIKMSPSAASSAPLRSWSIAARNRRPTSLTLLTTHLDAEQSALVDELVALLHSSSTLSSPQVTLTSQFSPSVTHLITPACSPTRRLDARTHKYFLCLLTGAYVITIDWVTECLSRRQLVSAADFLIAGDREAEGGAERARQRRDRGDGGLFDGLQVEPLGAWGRQETRRDVRSLVEAGRGVWREPGGEEDKADGEERRCVLLLDDSKERVKAENRKMLTPELERECKRKGVGVVSTSWLFSCISHFELQPVRSPAL